MGKIIRRLPEIFIDDSGKISLAKCCIVLIVLLIALLVISWVIFGVIEFQHTQRIPAIPQGLSWTITALVGCISALYASNKFSPTIPFKGEGE